MKFEWTDERRSEFDALIEFMINRNLQDCVETYLSKSAMEETDQYYYNDEDAWSDIQSIIKGEETIYG